MGEAGSAVANLLMAEGLIDADPLAYAQRVHAKRPDARPLTRVIAELEVQIEDLASEAAG
ncbi:MAG: hypothetical protein AAGC67_20000 [Myxococcota bacterium]